MKPNDGLRYLQKVAGRLLRIRYYTEVIGSVWDDERTLALSGANTYVSGLVQSIDTTQGSKDQILLEEGRIKFNDSVFFIAGSLDTTSGIKVVTLTVSGLDDVYRNVTPGVIVPQFLGDDVYKKFYGRFIPGGSLF